MALNMRPSRTVSHERHIKQWFRILVPAVCLVFPAVAWPQLGSGTIVVISYSKQKVIVAADSRANFGDGRYEDSHCKITALSDKLIFAATGIVGDSSYLLPEDLRFGAIDEARKALTSATSNPDKFRLRSMGTVGAVADIWGSTMVGRFTKASPVRLKEWLKSISAEHEPAFVIGIFVGLEPNGDVAVKFEHIDYGKPRPGLSVPVAQRSTEYPDISFLPDGITVTEAYGMPEIVQEINAGQTSQREPGSLQPWLQL